MARDNEITKERFLGVFDMIIVNPNASLRTFFNSG